jgi:hypothetical protein
MAIRMFGMGGTGGFGRVPVRPAFWVEKESGTVGASSTQSSAFVGGSCMVSIQTDEDCHVLIGPNPTATTSDFKLAAGQTQDFGINVGDKVAWIAAA